MSKFIQDITDPTKQVDFVASGLPTATTRTITMPNGDVRLIPNGSALPATATVIGEPFVLNGAGLHQSTDLVGGWTRLLPAANNAETLTGTSVSLATTPASVSSYVTTLVGNSTGVANLGTFTGSTIADNSSVKAALQALEIAVEAAGGGPPPLANGSIFVGNASNVATAVTMSGNATLSNAGVLTIGENQVANTMLADMAANTIKSNPTATLADPADLAVAAERIVGRTSTGNLTGLTPSEIRSVARRPMFLIWDGGPGPLPLNWDMANGVYQRITGANGPFGLSFPTNVVAGDTAFIYITQSAAGNGVISWNSAFKFPGGTAPTLSALPNALDRVEIFFHSSTEATVTITKDIR